MNTHPEVEKIVIEYKNKFDGIGPDGVFKKSVEEIMWLQTQLTSLISRIEEGERGRVRKFFNESTDDWSVDSDNWKLLDTLLSNPPTP